MSNENKKKTEPWRIVVFMIAILFIVFMWIKKDISAIYATMPAEQVVPLIATTVLVSVVKAAAIAGAILLVKWIVGRFKKNS